MDAEAACGWKIKYKNHHKAAGAPFAAREAANPDPVPHRAFPPENKQG